MMRLIGLLAVLGVFAASSAHAQQEIETYIYARTAATAPYSSGLRIPVAPSGTINTLQYIAADQFVTLTGAQTLTGPKTLTAPILGGTVTGTYTLGGTPTISSPVLTGTVTGTYSLGGTPTITSPTLSGTATGTYTLGGVPTLASPIITGTVTGAYTLGGTPSMAATALTGNLAIARFNGGTGATATTFWRGDGTWGTPPGSGGGGGATTVYLGVPAGTNAYSVATSNPTGFLATDQFMFCGKFANPNTGPSTLKVEGSEPFSIVRQTGAGLATLVGGEITPNGQICMQLASASGPWVMQTIPSGHSTELSVAGTRNVSLVEWATGELFIVNAAGVTLLLPSAATLPQFGGLLLQTIGTTVNIQPNAADGIKIGSASGVINTTVPVPAGATTVLTTTGANGANAFNLPLGPATPVPLSWGPTQDLAAGLVPLVGTGDGPRIVKRITCMISAVAGGAATLDVYSATNATLAASVVSTGTKLNSTLCNANTLTGSPGAFQNMGVAVTAPVAADSQIWLVGSGAGWSASTGRGKIQVDIQ